MLIQPSTAHTKGIQIRNKLITFAGDYGSTFYAIRRPLAVFITALLDTDHQETFKNTDHNDEKMKRMS
jgi:hypothetical protein